MSRVPSAIAILVWLALCAAAGFLALRTNLDIWLNVLYMLVTSTLIVALILARYSQGRTGAFWFGFAAVGWGLFLLGLGISPVTVQNAMGASTRLYTSEHLLTTDLLKIVHNTIHPPASLADVGQYGNRLPTAHLLLTMSVAVAGGAAAVAMRKLERDVAVRATGPMAPRRPWIAMVFAGSICLAAAVAVIGVVSHLNPRHPTYFSGDVTKEDTGLPAGILDACRKALTDMREPSLWDASRREPGLTAYRVVWVNWPGHPIAVRITNHHQERTLTLVVMDGGYTLKRGVVAVQKTVKLTETQWHELTKLVEKSSFWSMSTRDDDERPSSRGSFVLEGVQEGQYHAAERAAFRTSDYDRLCQYILDLTGFEYRLVSRSPNWFQ